ncbi:oxidoreductase [Rhizocola hellebori]|uniref:Oxidoreductase n=1 Tax=Rhizocola hellebori TaxID=1392758 RepID=A0A8J3VKH6_9ACTN|nr:SDR family oxidoreductase [Rhizocola hellebori]GIH09552.1 oxidoreductase [Rhizocola hellebori]
MNSSISNKVVLITGAARGIGEQVARQAVAKGAKVSVVGLEPERLKKLAGELGCHWAHCDVTDQAGLDLAVSSAVEAHGRIDVVLANAGVANIGTVNTGPVEALVRTINVNLNGVIRTVSAALPHLIESKGYALLVSSVAAFTAMPGMAAYCASKAGVEQFGNVLRLEVAHLGVRVGTAHPIWVDTDLVRDFREDLPSYRHARKKMPWPMSTELTAEQCAQALLRGMEKRKRRVYIPGSIGLVQALRTVMLSGFVDGIIKRGSGGGEMVTAMEQEARDLGRPFGSHSVGQQ